MTPARLVTIGISHFCEKARWALDFTATPFVEEAHAPLLHVLAARRAGGRSTPILVLDGQVLTDSTDILVALDARALSRGGPMLYPERVEERRSALELEELFDEKLGPAVRRAMYHLILPHRALSLALLGAHVPAGERRLLGVGFPLLRSMMRRGMRIDAAGAARSVAVIDRVFAEVDALLSDGRRYLVGDRFSAADLTFASLAAPALLAPGYGTALPGPADAPPRDRRAGEPPARDPRRRVRAGAVPRAPSSAVTRAPRRASSASTVEPIAERRLSGARRVPAGRGAGWRGLLVALAACLLSMGCGDEVTVAHDVTVSPLTSSDAMEGWAVNYPKQRKVFYAEGRLWLFYADGRGGAEDVCPHAAGAQGGRAARHQPRQENAGS